MGGEDEGAVLPNTSVAFAHFVCNYMNQCCKLSGFKNGRVNSLFWTEHESVFGLVQDRPVLLGPFPRFFLSRAGSLFHTSCRSSRGPPEVRVRWVGVAPAAFCQFAACHTA